MKICYAKKTKEHFDYVFNSFALVKVIPCNWKHIDKETLFCRNVLYLRFLGRPWKHKPRSQTLDSLTDGGGGRECTLSKYQVVFRTGNITKSLD